MKKTIIFLLLITANTFTFGQSRSELSRKIQDQSEVITQIGKDNFTLKQNMDEVQKAIFALLSNKDTSIVINGKEFQIIVENGVALIQDGQAVIDEAKKSNPNGLWAWLVAIFAAVVKFGGIGFVNSLLVRAQKLVAQTKGFVNGKPRFVLYAMGGSLLGSVIFEAINGGAFDFSKIAPFTAYIFLASVGVYELGLRPFQKWRETKSAA